MELSFEIDKITESIELAKTGERFETVVFSVKEQDVKTVNKANGWNFNCNYYALDDVGFVGIPNQRHTEKYFSEIGKIIAKIKRGQKQVVRTPC